MATWTLHEGDDGHVEVHHRAHKAAPIRNCGGLNPAIPVELIIEWMFHNADSFDLLVIGSRTFVMMERGQA